MSSPTAIRFPVRWLRRCPDRCATTPRAPADDDWDAARDPLVPVGGGKDSVVTIEALKRAGMRPMLFSVNKFDPIDRCIEVSGLDSVRVTRTIDRRLIEVNGMGAYNGHVPVTAINSVIGLIVADANGLGPVVLSNERSSNIGNVSWLGHDVNHQWSKSIHYETLLRDTLRRLRVRTRTGTSRCCARCPSPRSPTDSAPAPSTSESSSVATGRSRSTRDDVARRGADTAPSACSSSR